MRLQVEVDISISTYPADLYRISDQIDNAIHDAGELCNTGKAPQGSRIITGERDAYVGVVTWTTDEQEEPSCP